MDYTLVDLSEAEPHEVIPLLCLQGLVNRAGPRLYLVARPASDRHWVNWYHLYGLRERPMEPGEALGSFAEEADGLVVFDPELPDTLAHAVSLASARGLLPVSPAGAEKLGELAPVREDLRGRFEDRLDVYRAAAEEVWPECRSDVICSQRVPQDLHGFTPTNYDLAVARRSFTHGMTVSPEFPEEAQIYRDILAETDDEAFGFGWGVSTDCEAIYIDLLSRHGVLAYCGGGFNVSFHQHVQNREPLRQDHAEPDSLRLEDEVYVTFCLSDGDALWFATKVQNGNWMSPLRGSVPFGWEMQPRLAQGLGPALLEYYYRTRTPNDYLVTGPSGIAYNYPSVYPNREAFIRRTAEAMEATDSRTIWMINRVVKRLDRDHVSHRTMTRGDVPIRLENGRLVEEDKNTVGADYVDEEVAEDFIRGIPGAIGFFQGFEPIPGAEDLFVEGKPWFPTRIMGVTPEQTLREIESAASLSGDRPAFISVHCGASAPGTEFRHNALPALVRIAGRLREEGVRVVRPDEFLLLRQKAEGTGG